MDRIYNSILDQKQAAQKIQDAMTNLRGASESISHKARTQNSSGQAIHSSIEGTNNSLEESRLLVQYISKETDTMVNVFEKVQNAFSQTQEINLKLKKILQTQ